MPPEHVRRPWLSRIPTFGFILIAVVASIAGLILMVLVSGSLAQLAGQEAPSTATIVMSMITGLVVPVLLLVRTRRRGNSYRAQDVNDTSQPALAGAPSIEQPPSPLSPMHLH